MNDFSTTNEPDNKRIARRWLLKSLIGNDAFFAIVVRLQDDRGQTVVSAGPYRWVRHPGYTGGVLFSLATPVMLGSLWASPAGLVGATLLVLRTALEDRLLQERLDGYREYAQRTKYRLLPGVWLSLCSSHPSADCRSS